MQLKGLLPVCYNSSLPRHRNGHGDRRTCGISSHTPQRGMRSCLEVGDSKRVQVRSIVRGHVTESDMVDI